MPKPNNKEPTLEVRIAGALTNNNVTAADLAKLLIEAEEAAQAAAQSATAAHTESLTLGSEIDAAAVAGLELTHKRLAG
jgi:hypothetical protein